MDIKNLMAAIALEAMFQTVRKRGMKRGRPQFYEWASVIVEGMRDRGEV